MKTQLDYANMQKSYYESASDYMNSTGNHRWHDENPDYKDLLLSPGSGIKGIALDFGCGCGRNVSNMLKMSFSRVDGVDISSRNIDHTRENLISEGYPEDSFRLYVNNGIGLEGLESETYEFVMSTIVFQHICAYDTRFSLMKEIHRVMKDGGVFSFQMGFGNGHPRTSEYYDNVYDATSTNSGYDVKVTDPNFIVSDLEKIGFKEITYTFSQPWTDTHEKWIYVVCKK